VLIRATRGKFFTLILRNPVEPQFLEDFVTDEKGAEQ